MIFFLFYKKIVFLTTKQKQFKTNQLNQQKTMDYSHQKVNTGNYNVPFITEQIFKAFFPIHKEHIGFVLREKEGRQSNKSDFKHIVK